MAATSDTKPKLRVNIRSRDKVLFNGDAYSVTAYNTKGTFDILPQHANFVSLIKDFIILDINLPTKQEFKIDSGVLTHSYNNVKIYLGL